MVGNFLVLNDKFMTNKLGNANDCFYIWIILKSQPYEDRALS